MTTEIQRVIESIYRFVQLMVENPFLFIGTVIVVSCMIGTFVANGGKIKLKKNSVIELLIIDSCWVIFFFAMMFYKRRFIDNKIWLVIFCIVLLSWFVLFYFSFKKFSIRKLWKKSKTYIMNNYEIVIVSFIVLIISVCNMGISPLYDSNLYYGQIIKGLSEFTFGLTSFADSFTIWGKQFHPLAPFLVLSEFIYPGTGKGLYLFNTILLIGAVVCIYELTKCEFRKLTKWQSALISLLFAFFPFILVGVIYINPDFYCAVLFVYVVYFYKKEHLWLFSYTAIALLGAKSNMIITYILFIFFIEIKSIIKMKNIGRILREKPVLFWVVPLEIMLFFYYFGKNSTGSMAQGVNTLLEKNVNRFFQSFIFGFKWLILFLFFVTVLYCIYRYGIKKVVRKGMEEYILEIAIILSSFAQFLLYIVFSHKLTLCPRYFAQNSYAFIILIAFFLNVINVSQMKKDLVVLGFSILFGVQLFVTIDPSILFLAESINFSNGKVYIGTTKYKTESIGIGDNSTYNFEYALWSGLFNEMLKDNQWSQDIYLYSAVDDERLLSSEDFRYGIVFKGNYGVYWDSTDQMITYTPKEDTHAISIKSISAKNIDNYRKQLKSQDIIYLLEPDDIPKDIRYKIKEMGYKELFEKTYSNVKTQLKLVVLVREEK